MKKYEAVIEKLMEFEGRSSSMHHFYFTGKSVPVLEAYGTELVKKLEKAPHMAFKGIVKHFSVFMPYFDNARDAEKFVCSLKEYVSIARDCYDEYVGLILIECDKEWNIHGLNNSMARVLEYMKTLHNVRFVVLFPYGRKKSDELYTALSTTGVWAFVEAPDMDFRASEETCRKMIIESGYTIPDEVYEELCRMLEHRSHEIVNVEDVLSQWLSQVSLNRGISGDNNKEITMKDISLLSGAAVKKNTNMIGFATRR